MRAGHSLLASLCLGALMPLAFAPFEFWWLIPLLVAAHFFCWIGLSPKPAFWRGFAFGAGAFLTGTYWLYHSIVVIGQVPLALALVLMLGMVAIMAIYFGLNAALIMRYSRGSSACAAMMLPFVWILTEWLRGWVLSGFPWLTAGSSLPDTLLGGWLPVGGVYLGSFILIFFASILVLMIQQTGYRRFVVLALAGAVGLTSWALHDRDWSRDLDATLQVSIGQLGLDQSLKWERDQFQKTLKWYADFVVGSAEADLILMPEVAIPAVAARVEGYLGQLAQVARARDQTLATGILNQPSGQQPSNAILVIGGQEQQWYEKRRLVPFGEYFPVPAFVRNWMKLRGLPYSDIRSGERDQAPLTVGRFKAAASICYEDAYAALQLNFFPDAALIINVSNDAWFGDSIAPHQHLQIARTRSAESQRWQARSTNSGITALIDHRGHLVARVPAFEPAILAGELQMRAGHTPYTRFGNLPILLLGVIGLAAISLLGRNASRTGLPERQ